MPGLLKPDLALAGNQHDAGIAICSRSQERDDFRADGWIGCDEPGKALRWIGKNPVRPDAPNTDGKFAR